MFLLSSRGLLAYYHSNAGRFLGFLEILEFGIPYILDHGDVPLHNVVDLSYKVRWVLSDLMVLYFTIRASHGDVDMDDRYVLPNVFDNVRLALYIAYRLYCSVREYCFAMELDRHLPEVPHHSREVDWLYDNYACWRDLMAESYGGKHASVSAMRCANLDHEDVQVMSESRNRLERIMADAQINGIPVRHLLCPVNYSTSVWPMVRHMVELELRMRMKDNGQLGDTEIAPWHRDVDYVVPPSTVHVLTPRRLGDIV